MISSIQSVPGQPVASPDPRPIHQGVFPSLAIFSVSEMSSSIVFGISYPLSSKLSGEYQTKLFTFTL